MDMAPSLTLGPLLHLAKDDPAVDEVLAPLLDQWMVGRAGLEQLEIEHTYHRFGTEVFFYARPGASREEAEPFLRMLERHADSWGVAAALSIHPSGFVRQRAVENLARLRSPWGVPFLVTRSADWVDVIATIASTAAERDLAIVNDASLFDSLVAAHRIERRSRLYAAEVARLVREAVLKRPAVVRRAMRHSRAPVQRWLQQYLSTEALVSIAAADPGVRREIARRQLSSASIEERSDLIRRLAKDRVTSVRLMAVQAMRDQSDLSALSEARLDANFRVRAEARLALDRAGGFDHAAFYRERLPSPWAVAGLGEKGGPADAELVAPLLRAPTPRVRREAIVAVASLGGRAFASSIEELVLDPSLRVVRTAVRALDRLGTTVDGEAFVRVLHDPTSSVGQRRAALGSLKFLGRLQQVVQLIEAPIGPELESTRRSHLQAWVLRADRYPPYGGAATWQRAVDALERNRRHLPDDLVRAVGETLARIAPAKSPNERNR